MVDEQRARHDADPRPRVAVIGYGNVGRLFGDLLAKAAWHVTAIDPHSPPEPSPAGGVPDLRVQADIGRPTPELRQALSDIDVVIVAVPERAALAAVDVIDECVAHDVTIVETLSRKARFLQAAEDVLAPRPLVSLNPLFHPSLGWVGNTVTASVVRGGSNVDRLLHLIGEAGAQVHHLSPGEHDRCVTVVQAVAHAVILGFATTLPRLGLPPADVIACSPPPARALLALAARVLTANPETYWDIQNSGEPGATARTALRDSVDELDNQVLTGDDTAFELAFARLRTWLGDDLDRFADDAAHLLGALVARRSDSRTADR
ncbi:prephenate dehydrogenase [Saccharopolyspora antimicrobica]|uniref:Prephenate dehydrogenase n=1 Tax=Saccharopolyspora antimicrobica TaxID=455193 RepID=A0A1I5GQN3_9PSEU|nr:2-dehydropantoate 2-reductase N-terminal domain-containing protein [Saccharopolyspora antimicrobica]RKT87420.1 prephenate dehydrogenase [Saccharopolyspora antimicrobica]SFO37881.1 prephenate dehydrogenase [Saccharopolyspora antimicrobica]